jgi:hypothetical protein
MDEEEYKWKAYETYSSERRWLYDLKHSQIDKFDTNMIILSAGVFGLSVTFLTSVVKNNPDDFRWILFIL